MAGRIQGITVEIGGDTTKQQIALNTIVAVADGFRDIATTYFSIYCMGLIFQFGYNIVASLLRSVGDSKASMYFLLIASVVNIGLDLLFVAVF